MKKEQEDMVQQDPSVSRRRFIKQFVVGTAFSILAGRDWLGTLVADCTPTTAANGVLRIRISEFPALQADNGSVRLVFNPINGNQLPSNTAFYPVLINRAGAGQFFALNSRCTHEFCVVPPFDAGQDASVCPCHFSMYRIDGTVIAGSLARLPLSKFTVSFDGVDLLCIQIPNLGFSINGSTVENSVGPRFRLQFPTKTRLTYEVRFRQSTSDPGTVVPFSTIETGTATTNVLTATTTSATVY